jgi:hypothetical protein
VPKYDCPLFPPELHELKKIIDPTKVELDNIRNQFIVAKNFVIATTNNKNEHRIIIFINFFTT